MQPHTDLVALVTEQKALAQRNRSLRNWLLLMSIAAAALTFGLWYQLSPATPQTLKLRVVACAAVAALFLWLILPHYDHFFFPKRAACPECSYSWEIKEGRGVHTSEIMTNWDKCPGCGLPMVEPLLKKRLAASPPSS